MSCLSSRWKKQKEKNNEPLPQNQQETYNQQRQINNDEREKSGCLPPHSIKKI